MKGFKDDVFREQTRFTIRPCLTFITASLWTVSLIYIILIHISKLIWNVTWVDKTLILTQAFPEWQKKNTSIQTGGQMRIHCMRQSKRMQKSNIFILLSRITTLTRRWSDSKTLV